RYGATNGALASGFVTAELHHLWGHDRRSRFNFLRNPDGKRLPASRSGSDYHQTISPSTAFTGQWLVRRASACRARSGVSKT
ncbi:hypothetical protein FJ443_27780, partial [Mesorhizobium sp. B2-6-1]